MSNDGPTLQPSNPVLLSSVLKSSENPRGWGPGGRAMLGRAGVLIGPVPRQVCGLCPFDYPKRHGRIILENLIETLGTYLGRPPG